MDYKIQILSKLMYYPKLRFSDMQIEGMTSKHFTYYLKQLLDEGLIEKQEGLYLLTYKGKEYVGRIDEESQELERQPKVGVAIIVKRENDKGEVELLLSRRLKQPYYGKVGGFTGKVRFGEKFEETARRELLEEAGLTGNFKLAGVKRKFGRKNGECVQDQVMIFFVVTEPEGDLIEKTKENENFWEKYDDMKRRDDLYGTAAGFIDFSLNNEMENFEIEDEAKGY